MLFPAPRPLRAFTLIELLIVVAIIAILAAIAVPNFLEAQTRSKVSRVKSDMRTLSLGMESYLVDHNVYPIPSDPSGAFIENPVGAVHVSPFETRAPVTLTTPIAYLTSRPEDPFAAVRHGESRIYHTITRDYVDIRQNHAPRFNWALVYRRYFRQLTGEDPPSQIQYFFVSFGPNMTHNAAIPHTGTTDIPHVHSDAAVYDPTNGTISEGDLIYFGPGIGFP